MKIAAYSVVPAEKPYFKRWSKEHQVEVKLIAAPFPKPPWMRPPAVLAFVSNSLPPWGMPPSTGGLPRWA